MKKLLPVVAGLTLMGAVEAQAGTITGGDLLTSSYASLLTSRLGLSDANYTNISNLNAGASASQWHSDVSGYTSVISIYDVTYGGQNYLIGGYSSIGHDLYGYSGNDNEIYDTANFLFNLTIGSIFEQVGGINSDRFSQYDNLSYFATFGGGYDLYGGNSILGSGSGYSNNGVYGASSGFSYDFGTTGMFGDGSITKNFFDINGLESYAVSAVPAVPIPAAAWLFGTALAGLFGFKARRRSSAKALTA